ncbi:hypothetical protein QBC45DRAFT_410796 [Copromyces sp. CBS 386.78]|uniref:Uncharacterized protein n=1 Tax=Pseudoneurospora amorphoporcata TaxID=241081 RepID=A0AAN6NW63_9PEZI|nr:hypothetical protein QBC45DRAFT_410796 [Copromyces sp. CBS 386.78]KAK3950967.1 hypothetical protein QBC32DRAFT_240364 [Pseudoneurospora amorphoporcata]
MPSEGPERGQSPPPERQTGKQQSAVAGSGTGVDDASNKDQTNKSGLENLTSNPKGPLDDEVERKFAKTSKPEESK